ncbi:MAG: hypothetical protein F6K17_08135 [Okeania sp. SIO3C4]|nr:hypothetical protein [Okeania sp. SIO3C4]
MCLGASWWNGHLGGMGILVEWASWWNGHLARLYFPVPDIFTPNPIRFQGEVIRAFAHSRIRAFLNTYIHSAPQQCPFFSSLMTSGMGILPVQVIGH